MIPRPHNYNRKKAMRSLLSIKSGCLSMKFTIFLPFSHYHYIIDYDGVQNVSGIWGCWVAQLVKQQTLDFSYHDLRVLGLNPMMGYMFSGDSAWVVSLPLSLPLHLHSLFPRLSNKHTFKKQNV